MVSPAEAGGMVVWYDPCCQEAFRDKTEKGWGASLPWRSTFGGVSARQVGGGGRFGRSLGHWPR